MTEDDEVDRLLELFAVVIVRSGDDDADVDPGRAVVTTTRDGVAHQLFLPREVVIGALADARAIDEPRPPGVSVEEALARRMAVYLEESLQTRVQHDTGWWSFDGSFFNPVPPWEVPHQG